MIMKKLNMNRRPIILWLLIVRLVPSYYASGALFPDLISDPIHTLAVFFYPLILTIYPLIVLILIIKKKKIAYQLSFILSLLDSIILLAAWSAVFELERKYLDLQFSFIIFFLTFYVIALMYLSYKEWKET
jgi:hypothetical protein